ncbi:hypothetical protein IJJ37_00590 [Candidatus Saccharibacteria bacterium]|nr:hypothetical protein [Candidatus Saccharibacteria bacterium]
MKEKQDAKKENVAKSVRVRERGKMLVGIATIVVMLIVVVVILAVVSRQEPISEGYFRSDDTKLVLSLTPEVSAFELNEEYEPEVTRIVYFYDGNKVTGAKIYFEYADEEAARKAYDNTSMEGKTWATSRRLNGRYIVYSVKAEQYKDLTAEQVRENIAGMKAAGGVVEEPNAE